MSAALEINYLSPEDYLASEESRPVRHEYIAGQIYAMSGVSRGHSQIASNLHVAFRLHLRGAKCEVHQAEVKVRIQIARKDFFYYPDLMVGCDPRDTHRLYLRYPKIIVEVLSDSTESTDRREKLLSYMQIETLEEYVIVAQDQAVVTVFRRANDWKPETLIGLDAELKLDSIQFSISLRDLYERVSV